MATGDKYDPLILPYCKPTPSQVLILQSCPLLSPQSEEEADVIPSSSSSSSEEEEQATGIMMVSLPDSSDDNYQTPPEEHHSISQNIAVDEAGNVVDLDNDTEEILDDEIDGEKIVTEEEDFDTEPQKDADQVFDEMPQREHEASKSDVAVLDRGKRKLPVSLDKKGERGGECSSKHDVFKETINRVLTMLVAEGKGKGDDGKGVDFLETAKKKGMTFPRPRWRSAETWKGSGHVAKFRCTVMVDGVSYTSPDTFQQRKTAEMVASRIAYFDFT